MMTQKEAHTYLVRAYREGDMEFRDDRHDDGSVTRYVGKAGVTGSATDENFVLAGGMAAKTYFDTVARMGIV